MYPSAQRRKLRDFDGYRRIAVAVVADEETYKERCQRREIADGKEVPDPAILDMKGWYAGGRGFDSRRVRPAIYFAVLLAAGAE